MTITGLLQHIWQVQLDYFLLMAIRVSALIISSPIFGRRNVPNTTKIAFCVLLTVLFYYVYPPSEVITLTFAGYVGQCLLELLFGLVLGYVLNLFFTLVFVSGNLADMQIGFGMVNVFDPQSGISVPVTGTLLNFVLLICFFMVNGHIRLITMVYQTFSYVPVGHVMLSPHIGYAALNVFVTAFLLAINVAMPFIAMGIVVEAVLGVLIRTIPQMNMFVVGMPLKLIVGLVMVVLVMGVFVPFSNTIFEKLFGALEIMFAALIA